MKIEINNKLSAYMIINHIIIKTTFAYTKYTYIDTIIPGLIIGENVFVLSSSRFVKELYNENKN